MRYQQRWMLFEANGQNWFQAPEFQKPAASWIQAPPAETFVIDQFPDQWQPENIS